MVYLHVFDVLLDMSRDVVGVYIHHHQRCTIVVWLTSALPAACMHSSSTMHCTWYPISTGLGLWPITMMGTVLA